MNNLKKYNLFILLSTFGRLLIEVFIPLIIYRINENIYDVIFMYFVKYIIIILLVPVLSLSIRKLKLRTLLVIGNIFFILLSFYTFSLKNIYVYSFLYAGSLLLYWVVRHIYGIKITEDKKTTENVSSYIIYTLIGSLFATYIGSVILDKFNSTFLCIIIIIIITLSLFPLYKSNIKEDKITKTNIMSIITKFSVKNYIIIFIEQIKTFVVTIFPIYIYLYVAKSFRYIGIVNFLTCLASILCILFLSKKMDENKKDYMSFFCVLLTIIWILKINVEHKIIFLIIVFFDGLIKSGLDTIIMRNIYSYGREFKLESYSIFIELIKNVFRAFILGIILLLRVNLDYIIYLGILSLFINIFIKFDDGKFGYGSVNKIEY